MVWRTINGRRVNIGAGTGGYQSESNYSGKTFGEVNGNTFKKEIATDGKKNDKRFKEKLVSQVQADVKQLEKLERNAIMKEKKPIDKQLLFLISKAWTSKS